MANSIGSELRSETQYLTVFKAKVRGIYTLNFQIGIILVILLHL